MNKGPITYSYWVVPEKVLAGEYPGNQMRKSGIFRVLRTLLDQSIAFIRHPLQGWPTEYKRVKKLLSAGVTNYLDLTQSEELLPYETLLNFPVESWDEKECPDWLMKIPIHKPGSTGK